MVRCLSLKRFNLLATGGRYRSPPTRDISRLGFRYYLTYMNSSVFCQVSLFSNCLLWTVGTEIGIIRYLKTAVPSRRSDNAFVLSRHGTRKSLLHHHTSKLSIFFLSASRITHVCDPQRTTGKNKSLSSRIFLLHESDDDIWGEFNWSERLLT